MPTVSWIDFNRIRVFGGLAFSTVDCEFIITIVNPTNWLSLGSIPCAASRIDHPKINATQLSTSVDCWYPGCAGGRFIVEFSGVACAQRLGLDK